MTSEAVDYTLSLSKDQGTIGCTSCNMNCIYIPSGAQDVIKSLHRDMLAAKTESLRRQVEAFCSCLSSGMLKYRIDWALPQFMLDIDDEEFYIEWIFDYYRFGFDFYDDDSRSGWFALVEQQGDDFFRFHSKFNNDYRKAVDYALTIISRDS
ncbi:MAG: hypothetical protein Q4Q58_03900 [Thermoplasmata archaeon]|nr:hypothetical protein [Thermoplasmata archaeon]